MYPSQVKSENSHSTNMLFFLVIDDIIAECWLKSTQCLAVARYNLGKSSGVNTISGRKIVILRTLRITDAQFLHSCVPHIQSAGSSLWYHISHSSETP